MTPHTVLFINFNNYMKKELLFWLLLFSSVAATAQARVEDYPSGSAKNRKAGSANFPNEDYPVHISAKRNLKKFNYFYLRLSYPFASSTFGNPMNQEFPGNQLFVSKDKLQHRFRAGLELGAVNHITELGHYMVKLGINYGFNFQTFGPFENRETHHRVASDGTYIATLGLGPQVTFKPVEAIRVAVFGRIGISALYHNYENVQETAGKVKLDMLNYGLAKDIGIDFTLKKFSVGFTWSFLNTAPGNGQLYIPENKEINSYTPVSGAGTPLNDKVYFNRVSFNLGFAF